MENIQAVDDIVFQVEQLIHQFYRDDKTAYIFTADHGMSAIGNHGDGGIVPISRMDRVPNTLTLLFRTRKYRHTLDSVGCWGPGPTS